MSPFKSKAQRRKLYATNPKVAEQFEKETPKGAKLPERVKKKKKPGIRRSGKAVSIGY